MSNKDLNLSQEDKKNILKIAGGIFAVIFVLYGFMGDTVYDCNDVESRELSSSLNACFEKDTRSKELALKREEIETQKEIKMKEIDLAHELKLTHEKNRHCEALKKMGKECPKKLEELAMLKSLQADTLLKRRGSCSDEVKATMCKPRFFLWKYWYF